MHSRKRPHSISGVWEEIVGEIISLIHPKWGQENMHGVGHNKGLSTCMYLNKYMKENKFHDKIINLRLDFLNLARKNKFKILEQL